MVLCCFPCMLYFTPCISEVGRMKTASEQTARVNPNTDSQISGITAGVTAGVNTDIQNSNTDPATQTCDLLCCGYASSRCDCFQAVCEIGLY